MENNTALALPDEATFRHDIMAINRFQQVVRATMVSGQDYGIIPGTSKPTLLKPGAEKIAKLLGLCDQYELVDRQESWEKGFFRYLIKCRLSSIQNGTVVSEGLGECNSMESKYRWRWLFASQLPAGLQGDAGKPERDKLTNREIKTKNGWAKQYRFDNDDIYSQVNTILKMAKKRALVDAALSAGRLSEVFTQDMEDIGPAPEAVDDTEPKPIDTIDKSLDKKPEVKPEKAVKGKVKAETVDEPVPAEPKSLNNLGEFFTACNLRWGITSSEVEKLLGKSKSQFGDLYAEWAAIKKVQGK